MIFDCDGVLVDSERICVKIDVRVMADLGCDFTEEEVISTFVGSSFAIRDAFIEERLGRPLAPEWYKAYDHLYEEALATELTAIDGVADAIGTLEALGLPFCLASNGGHANIRRNLATAGLRHHFAEARIFSAADVALGKPAPDLFLHAARTLGVDPARCAVVEDSPYGVTAARAAGMRSFGYAGGLTAAHRLAGPGTVVFEDMRELPGLLSAARAVS
ncbi:HAD family hydrolase [Streptomyces paludis]|uniref:HAD family phosphatase n=1 Tax=Streptomyces paludis TaxID=2282738 RepID=A0A345HT76_9ACTN|nr:HAD family phosphatase [Streptomyces paludis]AXG79900.1 HAD family phosphatase [Streptomyces paludis]